MDLPRGLALQPAGGLIHILGRVRVLLTNDDGIEAEGLQALRRALLAVPGVELAVIAPDRTS